MSLELFNERFYNLINEKVRNKVITEEEIRLYSYLIEPNNFYQNYVGTTSFLREYKDDLDWQQICMWQLIPENFVREMKDYVYFNELLCNHPTDYSEKFYRNYFKDYFDKNVYLETNEHPYNSVSKDIYKKQICSVGQALDHALALKGMVKLELLYKYELKQNVKKWVSRLSYTNPKYCK